MKIRNKLFLVTSLTLAVILIAIVFISRTYYLNNFAAIERTVIQKDIDRTVNTLNALPVNLDITVLDWAAWDDTYRFVKDLNQDYIDSNIFPEEFRSLNINYMLYLSTSGKVVYYQGYDVEEGEFLELPSALTELVSQGEFVSALSQTDGYLHGFVKVQDNILVFSARPILKNKQEGPVRGSLILAYNLDAEEIASLAGNTQLTIEILPLESDLVPEATRADLRLSTLEIPTSILPVSSDTICAYLLVRDVFGQPAFFVHFDEPRTLYTQGLASVNLITFFVLLTGVVSAITVFVFVEYFVVARVNRTMNTINKVRRENEWGLRLPIKGRDELSDLDQELNLMLDMRQRLDKQIRRLARTDSLTGLLNRRTMDGTGKYEIERARRKQQPLSVLMIDLDHFKDINDKNNHTVGDQVLKGVAKILSANTRSVDYLCRYGGDEFAIIMPDASEKQARVAAERLRSMIQQGKIPTDNGPQRITASIGITTTEMGAADLLTLYKQADEALYKAKDTGRNRTLHFQDLITDMT